MLIKDWMAKNPVTITEDTSMVKAIHIMKERRFRRLPVVAQGKLVGMVTDRDLKEASPSKATTLDVHELYYLLAELQVQEIMSRNPISVSEDDTVEHAAQIMLEHTISGLPVVDESGAVVGLITQSDVFRAFMHITGVLQGGVQFALRLEDRPGLIKEVVDLLRARGARFVSLLSSYATSRNEACRTLRSLRLLLFIWLLFPRRPPKMTGLPFAALMLMAAWSKRRLLSLAFGKIRGQRGHIIPSVEPALHLDWAGVLCVRQTPGGAGAVDLRAAANDLPVLRCEHRSPGRDRHWRRWRFRASSASEPPAGGWPGPGDCASRTMRVRKPLFVDQRV